MLKEAAENLYTAASMHREEAAARRNAGLRAAASPPRDRPPEEAADAEAADAAAALADVAAGAPAAASPPPRRPPRTTGRRAARSVFAPPPDESRGKYHCGRCGKKKVNHVCTAFAAPLQRSWATQACRRAFASPLCFPFSGRPRTPRPAQTDGDRGDAVDAPRSLFCRIEPTDTVLTVRKRGAAPPAHGS